MPDLYTTQQARGGGASRASVNSISRVGGSGRSSESLSDFILKALSAAESFYGINLNTNSPILLSLRGPKSEQKSVLVKFFKDKKEHQKFLEPGEEVIGDAPEKAEKLQKVQWVDKDGRTHTAFISADQTVVSEPKPVVTKPQQQWQFDSARFGKRMHEDNVILNGLGITYDRTKPEEGAKAKFLPEFLKHSALKQQEQAERNFVNALLRDESGASIAKSEFDSASLQYFPREGDTAEVIAQKAANRLLAIEGMKAASGDAWNVLEQMSTPQPPQSPSVQAPPPAVSI